MQKIREIKVENARTASENTANPYANRYAILYRIYSILPKTVETPLLMERWINEQMTTARDERARQRERERLQRDKDKEADLDAELEEQRKARRAGGFIPFDPTIQRLTRQEVRDIQRARSAPWLIATSLAFEITMLALATWVFTRRDY